ncbi:MAG: helix-turn-helix domain-containing protein, partial [Candidatus Dormibacteraeota bacterium]|nr:helix-turn-helix domain-containing protein [Candidatus Dormibacteraeota bacterium]
SDGGAGESWLEPPTATVTMILNLGDPFGGMPAAFVAGLSDRYEVVQGSETMCCLDVKLTPPGAYGVLGVPMDEIAGRAADVGDVLGRPALELVDRLREAPGWEERFELFDTFLLRRLAETSRPSAQVEWTWRRLVDSGGLVPVGRLAAEAGWSTRHLTEMCRRQLGLPPKVLARVIRFNRLLKRLDREAAVRWAELAVDCGYYDQAHLHRDFRQFAGTTPAGFLAGRLPA